MFAKLFARRPDPAAALYAAILERSRNPAFFERAGVPDTLEGRFEVLALHAWLVMQRLAEAGSEASAFNQRLFDVMFEDLDANLREAGVGDLSVGKKIKELASHYYGRVQAYDGALAAGDPGALAAALDRNLFGSTLPDRAAVDLVADYVRRSRASLAEQPLAALLDGREPAFAPPP